MMINGFAATEIAASDRGLQFGDGCFTTARIRQGEVVWCDEHLARLQQTCQRLMIHGVLWSELQQEMRQMAASQQEAILKVVITRGMGGRGYSIDGCGLPSRLLSISSYPRHYAQWRKQGIKLCRVNTMLSINPLLAGLKHLNRLEQVLIKAELDSRGEDEALVLDTSGLLVECCAANLFWRKGKKLFTPDLSGCGVAGVARQRLMRLAEKLGYRVEQVRTEPEVLDKADEVLISNALLPLLPVRQIESRVYSCRDFYYQVTAEHHEWM